MELIEEPEEAPEPYHIHWVRVSLRGKISSLERGMLSRDIAVLFLLSNQLELSEIPEHAGANSTA